MEIVKHCDEKYRYCSSRKNTRFLLVLQASRENDSPVSQEKSCSRHGAVNGTAMSDETVNVVLEEAEVMDCEADIEADDDNIQYHLYAVNRGDDATAYKVIHLGDNCRENGELSIAAPVHNAVQVLSPLSGQFYVLGDGNGSTTDVVTSEYAKTCVTRLEMEESQNIVTRVKKRDERRRVTHNEVERRRRDKINNWIAKLGKLLADCQEQNVKGEGEIAKANLEPQSKGGILARACEYITELRDAHEKLVQSTDESARLMEEAKNLRQLVSQLRNENSQLKIRISKGNPFTILDP